MGLESAGWRCFEQWLGRPHDPGPESFAQRLSLGDATPGLRASWLLEGAIKGTRGAVQKCWADTFS